MLWQALVVVCDLECLYEIASILICYGLGDIVRRMGMANVLERKGRALDWKYAYELTHLEPHTRVRHALETRIRLSSSSARCWRRWPPFPSHNFCPQKIIRQFEQSLRRELDISTECCGF